MQGFGNQMCQAQSKQSCRTPNSNDAAATDYYQIRPSRDISTGSHIVSLNFHKEVECRGDQTSVKARHFPFPTHMIDNS